MERTRAFEVRDGLLDELGGVMRSTEAPPSSAPSIGVFVQGGMEGWNGRYGLSILLPEDAGEGTRVGPTTPSRRRTARRTSSPSAPSARTNVRPRDTSHRDAR